MRSNGGLYTLTLLAMLAPSHAVSQSPSNGNYGVDSPLFSSDDLSGFHSVTDSNVVSDDSLLGNLSTNDDTTTLFAENIDDCASDDTIQPGRKIRARDDLLCPSGLGSNSPAIRLPSVGDVENVVKPDPDSFKPQEVWHRGLGYYSICPSQYKKLADWVVCGIQGTSIGQAMWEYDVYDADLFFYGITKCETPRQLWCCEKYNGDARTGSFCELLQDLMKGPWRDGFFKS